MANKSSRRHFVKRSAALVAGSIVLPHIIPSTVFVMGRRVAPSDRIVIGAIGAGSQGMSNMRDFLNLKDALQFVAVCDVGIHIADCNKLQGIFEIQKVSHIAHTLRSGTYCTNHNTIAGSYPSSHYKHCRRDDMGKHNGTSYKCSRSLDKIPS